jgi:hypothetical protein
VESVVIAQFGVVLERLSDFFPVASSLKPDQGLKTIALPRTAHCGVQRRAERSAVVSRSLGLRDWQLFAQRGLCVVGFALVGLGRLNVSNAGLEREFWFSNRLEGRVCTTCAPVDQEKSCDSQREQAFLK